MGVGRIVNDFYNGLSYESLDEWAKNQRNLESPEVDWKPVDLCISMCCYAKINRTDDGDYCTCCGGRMSGS